MPISFGRLCKFFETSSKTTDASIFTIPVAGSGEKGLPAGKAVWLLTGQRGACLTSNRLQPYWREDMLETRLQNGA